jgi:hypothetical protein
LPTCLCGCVAKRHPKASRHNTPGTHLDRREFELPVIF